MNAKHSFKTVSHHEMNAFFSKKGDLRMMTLKGMKGSKPRVQKIGYVNDLLKKVSDHYYIVREKNKKHEGYHFHAIYSVKRDCRDRVFHLKHIHIHVRNVGKKYVYDPIRPECILPAHTTPPKDLLEWSYRHIDKVAAKISAHNATLARRGRKKSNVDCVINYLNKDCEGTKQYEDYVLVLNKKQCCLVH